jgi:hypothetical protein
LFRGAKAIPLNAKSGTIDQFFGRDYQAGVPGSEYLLGAALTELQSPVTDCMTVYVC